MSETEGIDVTHPDLQQICLEADIDLRKYKRQHLCWLVAGKGIGIFTICLSALLAQQNQLKPYLGESLLVLIGYLVAVLVALDKFLGLDTWVNNLSRAYLDLWRIRNEAYTEEKAEITKRSGEPVAPEFAAELVKRVGTARIRAKEILVNPRGIEAAARASARSPRGTQRAPGSRKRVSRPAADNASIQEKPESDSNTTSES